MQTLLLLLLLLLPAAGSFERTTTLSFSAPRVVSPPVQCYSTPENQSCGYLASATCRCPQIPAAADSYYGLDGDGTHMFGVYSEREKGTTEIAYTSDGGESWKLKEFFGPTAAFAWNLYPVEGGSKRRSFGGISLGFYRNHSLGSVTDRGWTSKRSATYGFDTSGELQMQVTGPVTVGPLPQAVNNTNGAASVPVAPQFYGGPIEMHDGSLLGTIGVYWAKDDPLSRTADGPEHRMSLVAIRSTDDENWHFAGVVANASGPGGYPNSSFGPTENDLAVLADGKTLMCVIRMDGDGRCSTNSYQYYGATYSRDMVATWSRVVAMPGVPSSHNMYGTDRHTHFAIEINTA